VGLWPALGTGNLELRFFLCAIRTHVLGDHHGPHERLADKSKSALIAASVIYKEKKRIRDKDRIAPKEEPLSNLEYPLASTKV